MKRYSFVVLVFLALIACEEKTILGNQVGPELTEWSIPAEEVRDGGVGRDGIPSIDRPTFTIASKQEVLFDHELVSGIVINGQAIAYPHKILDYHEIVNAEHEGFAYALSFCPLTGTSVAFPREINGVKTTFGVSGLLFNSNLILYDRSTESLWQQMMLQSVRGEMKDETSSFVQVVETTWATWNNWYPESLVLDPPNGDNRSYDEYAYGGYRTNHDLVLFPPANDFTGFPRKERLLGIVDRNRMFHFRFNQFQNVSLLNTKAGITDVIVFGNEEKNYLFAYGSKTISGESVVIQNTFEDQSGGRLFEDTNGNVWSIFGEVIQGPDTGAKLQRIQNFIGYSFAMAAFYPNDFFDRSSTE